MGYTNENAGERPILKGGGKGGMDRLSVVLFLDGMDIRIARGGGVDFHGIYSLRRGEFAVLRNN